MVRLLTRPDELAGLLGVERQAWLDPLDQVQLAHVMAYGCRSRSPFEAERTSFSACRARRTRANDAERLRKYLVRFDLTWHELDDRP